MALLLVAPVAGAQSDPQQLLAKAKQASGGAAWDAIRSTHTQVKASTGGLNGTGEAREDTRTGRFVDRYQLGPITGAQGFDGKTLWSQDASKQVKVEDGDDERLGAMNDAYRRSLAFWYPERWPAQIESAGEKEENGRKFFVVRITPRGGRPFDIWIDAATYLFDRAVEKAAIETRTSFFSNYREVAGVKVPFASRVTNGEAKYDQIVTIEKVEFNVPVEEAAFRMPPPPAPDFTIAGGKTSTTVPFELLNNHIYVRVQLNGKGPFRMLCDTGGANIVTPELAKELGLKTEGALEGRGVGEKSEDVAVTQVEELEVGGATVADQVFAVFPLASLANAEGVAAQGLIGYEVFKRFVVRVDYERSELTLTIPSAFAYKGSGTVVPFKFNGSIPQVEGEIDDIVGKFDIDTGSRASLSVLGPFAEKYDLKARYGAKVEAVTGWGVGGAARGLVTRAKVLKLGSVSVENPVTELSLQKKGAFTDPYAAGNVGAGVLKRFNIVFDYGKQQMIFERNANATKPDTFDRAGMWMNLADGVFEVIDVIAGGPAAEAGIKPGDRILSINGKTPAQLSLPAARVKLKSDPPGTKVRVKVKTGEQTREATIVLRDLV
ncbi:MAG: aspartyl protease family protein [Acidobacteria bacterium]|nr:aspartyl protease family protein [Acidobacteriota bacterium]